MLEGSLRVGYACVLELRKLNGNRRVPRLSVRAADASHCMSVVLPLVEASPGRWVADRTKAPPALVTLLSLARRALAMEGSGEHTGAFSLCLADAAAGGQELRATSLSPELFAATAMRVGGATADEEV